MPKVAALPYDFTFDPATTAVIMIDMQRDFIEPGGFGATLGNDVSLLAAIVPTAAKVLDACRSAGMTWPTARPRSLSAASHRCALATRARWAAS